MQSQGKEIIYCSALNCLSLLRALHTPFFSTTRKKIALPWTFLFQSLTARLALYQQYRIAENFYSPVGDTK